MSVAVLWAEEKQTGPGRVVVERKEAAGVGGSVLEGRPLGAEGATCCGGDSGRSWGPEGGVAVGENHRGGGGGLGGLLLSARDLEARRPQSSSAGQGGVGRHPCARSVITGEGRWPGGRGHGRA